MRKYLIPEKGNFYKANLHSHTNLSDGALSPEEVKEAYKSRGYSINAFTDHEVLWNHYDELRDDEFLPIVATEIGVNDGRLPFAISSSVHLSIFSRDPHEEGTPFKGKPNLDWLLECNYITQEAIDSRKWTGIIDNVGDQYAAKINEMIRVFKEKGFIVSLNHPTWSLLNKGEYLDYEGLWGVEVYNHGCFNLTGDTNDERVFEDILRSGRNIFPLCTDDSHFKGSAEIGKPNCDGFGGWVMVKADALEYDKVFEALEKGDFYCSTGPEIYELYYEDGKIHIECSEAREIIMNCLTRCGERYAENDRLVTSADFKLNPDIQGYVRFKVIDNSGRVAYTRAFYVDELLEGATRRRALF